MTISEKIQYYRKKSGLSQEALAGMLFVSRQTISLWETGQTLPTIDNLIRLREIFGISLDAILCDNPDNTSNSVEAAVVEPIESCSVSYDEDDISIAKRAYLNPRFLIGGVFLSFIAAIIVYLFLKMPQGVLLAVLCATLSLLIVGFSYVVYEISTYNKRCSVTPHNTVWVKIYEDYVVAEYMDENGETTNLVRCKVSEIRVKRNIRGYLVLRLPRDTVYLKETDVDEDSSIRSFKTEPKHFTMATVCISLIFTLALCFFTLDLTINIQLNRILADAEIIIPKYASITEKHDMGLVNGKYVEYFAEIYFQDENISEFERNMQTDDKWKSIDYVYNELSEKAPDEDIYNGAEYCFFCGDESTGYTLAVYFADENMLRVVKFNG